jgi:hypothetical protein
MEAERQRTEADHQRMEVGMVAERQRMELHMFEYMMGVYAAIGQPPPPFDVLSILIGLLFLIAGD